MSDILDKAAAHFSESGDQALHEIPVSEWESSVWFKSSSSMNGTTFNKYMSYLQSGTFESLIDQLILRARNKDGLKLFTSSDKKALMNRASPQVMGRIVNEMARVDNEAEAVEKKG